MGKCMRDARSAKGPDPVMRKVRSAGCSARWTVVRVPVLRAAATAARMTSGCAVYTVWGAGAWRQPRALHSAANDSRSSAIDASLASARSIEAEDLVEQGPLDVVARKRAHRGKRVRHVADGDRAERRHLTGRSFDGWAIFLGSFGGPDPHHAVDPGNEPVSARDFAAQRRELDVSVRVDQTRDQRATRALDPSARVARQDLGGGTHVEDG